MDDLKRVYYDIAYDVTKTVLSPVVDAISDSISEAIQRGTREALLGIGPLGFLDLLRKRK